MILILILYDISAHDCIIARHCFSPCDGSAGKEKNEKHFSATAVTACSQFRNKVLKTFIGCLFIGLPSWIRAFGRNRKRNRAWSMVSRSFIALATHTFNQLSMSAMRSMYPPLSSLIGRYSERRNDVVRVLFSLAK